jgi:tRNA(fMet)-specific endonuclease VapC
MSDWLLDTNVVSEAFKPAPHPEVARRLRLPGDQFFVPAPAWHELVYGAARLVHSARRAALEAFLGLVRGSMIILPYDDAAAAHHARERGRLEQAGRAPAFVDAAIAAIAVTRDLPLVTRNVADFAHFTNLRIEDWFT